MRSLPGLLALLGVVTLAAAAASAVSSAPASAQEPPPVLAGGEFVPLPPERILDTRTGLGRPTPGPVPAGRSIDLQITGAGGVPTTGVDAVLLNVTVTEPQRAGYVTVHPCCGAPPTASNLNFTAGETVANAVLVPVGPSGAIRLFASGAQVHLVADVNGWFTDLASDQTGGRLTTLDPVRLLDTRSGVGVEGVGPVPKDEPIEVPIAGRGGIPADATAVVLNVTGTEPTGSTFVTVYPGDEPRPVASSLNLRPGETRPNLVVVKLGESGSVRLFNSGGTVHLLADALGYFRPADDPASLSGRVLAISPLRMFDTRSGSGPVGPRSSLSYDVGVWELVVGARFDGFIANVTATGGTADTFVSVGPFAEGQVPATSNLNPSAGQTIPNLVVADVDAARRVRYFNNSGATHLISDAAAVVLSD